MVTSCLLVAGRGSSRSPGTRRCKGTLRAPRLLVICRRALGRGPAPPSPGMSRVVAHLPDELLPLGSGSLVGHREGAGWQNPGHADTTVPGAGAPGPVSPGGLVFSSRERGRQRYGRQSAWTWQPLHLEDLTHPWARGWSAMCSQAQKWCRLWRWRV